MAGFGAVSGFVALAITAYIGFLAYHHIDNRDLTLILAASLVGHFLGSIVVTISLALGGPVGRFKVSASRDGATIEVDGDGEPIVSVNTTTTVTAPVEEPDV